MKRYDYRDVLSLSLSLLGSNGVRSDIAKWVAEGVCEASLRGVDSHGINLLPHYIASVRGGRKNGNPVFKVESKYSGSVVLDADHTFGIAAGRKAVELGVERSDLSGISSVLVYRSTHPGCLGSVVRQAAQAGVICVGFANADSLMFNPNSGVKTFGTNPICVSAPRREVEPFCLDMATTIYTWNKIKNYIKNGHNLPNEVAGDRYGTSVNDPALAEGLFPIGGIKGFGIASVVEVLTSVISGMPVGPEILAMYAASINEKRNLAQHYLFIKPDILISEMEFFEKMQGLTDHLREVGDPAVGCPGDPEIAAMKERSAAGIPIDSWLIDRLDELCSEAGQSPIKPIQ